MWFHIPREKHARTPERRVKAGFMIYRSDWLPTVSPDRPFVARLSTLYPSTLRNPYRALLQQSILTVKPSRVGIGLEFRA